MLFIFNKNDQVIEILQDEDFFDDEYKQQINGEWLYTFHIDRVNKNIVKDNKIGFFDEDGKFQLFIIDDTEEVFNYGKKYDLLVSCLHDFYDLRFSVIEDKRVVNGSARLALEKCLEGTSYFVGSIAELGNANINFYYTNSLAGINEIIKTYGGEVYFRIELNENKTAIARKYVDIKYNLGEDTGLRFTFDLNLEEVKKKEHGDIFTVLYGRGSSLESGDGYSRKIDFADIEWRTPTNPINKPRGQKYIENVEAIRKYGRKEGIFEDGNIKTAEELIKATYEKLQEYNNHKVTYTVTVEDLSNILGCEHLKVKLGDTIIILDEEYNILINARIIEQRYSISKDNRNKQLTLGNFIKGLSDSENSNISDRLDKIESKPNNVGDKNFPDTLPSVPVVTTIAGFAVIEISWTYENKLYYTYEVYGSKVQNFTPNFSNLIFKGQTSSFLHEVKPQETWYYKVRAINTHGKATEFSSQVSGSTTKITDGTEYFESAAIKDALIGSLRLDRAWVGQLKGNKIDAREMSVTDGNGVRTVYISSNGNVELIGTLKSGDGDFYSELSRGGLVLTYKNEEVGWIRSSSFEADRFVNGMSIIKPNKAEYLDISYSTADTLSGSVKFFPFIRFTTKSNGLTGNFVGIQLKHNVRVDNGRIFSIQSSTAYDHDMFSIAGGYLGIFGDNGIKIGYKSGNNHLTVAEVLEVPDSQGCKAGIYNSLNMHGNNIKNVANYYYSTGDIMGAVKGNCTRVSNLNTFFESGWYACGSDCANTPEPWGVVHHFKAFSGDFAQWFHGTTNKLYIRWYVNKVWTNWKVW